MQTRKPNAAPYIVAAVAIAAAIWSVLGAPHSERPVTQQIARSTIHP